MCRSTSLIALSLLAACAPDIGVKAYNAEPDVEIVSHVDGTVVEEGAATLFRAVASDVDDDETELLATWTVMGAPVCVDVVPGEDGTTTCELTLVGDDDQVAVEVRDPRGAAGTDVITVVLEPNAPPVVEIREPADGATLYAGATVVLDGLAIDDEDAEDDLQVVWASDPQGVLVEGAPDASGNTGGTAIFDEGTHVLSLTATDTLGNIGVASIIVEVGPPNTPPDCAILTPADGAGLVFGQVVRLEGEASDDESAAAALVASWASDADGALWSGAPDSDGGVSFSTADLSAGVHRLSLEVVDEAGVACSASVSVSVGYAPEVRIDAPADGAVVNEGERVVFSGDVSDADDGPAGLALTWSSDVSGVLSTAGADGSGATTFSTTSLAPGPQIVTLQAVDPSSLTASAAIDLFVNQVPTTPSVTLTPPVPTTVQDLVATAAGAVDPDATGPISYVYTWYEDGVLSGWSSSATFPAAGTVKGRTYMVEARASDGDGEGPPATASVEVVNTSPVISALVLDPPSGAGITTTLTCLPTASDVDGDTPSLGYAWVNLRGLAVLSTSASVTLDPTIAQLGDTVQCTVTATDDEGATDVASASVVLDNEPPSVDLVTITPSVGVTTASSLGCLATVSDPDGPAPSVAYAWTNASTGASLGAGATVALDPVTVAPTESVRCTATATDAAGATDVGSASVTVDNQPPVVADVVITPSTGVRVGSVLVCSATATDPDGWPVAPTFVWTNTTNGASLGTGSIYAVDAGRTDPGQLVACLASATDAHGGVASASASVAVENSLPSIVSVTISPDPATAGDTLVCSWAGFSDADGDVDASTASWTVNGAAAGAGPVLAATVAAGDVITCTVTPSDGRGAGTAVSDVIVIGNSAPVLTSVSLTPDPADETDVLSCAPGAVSDPDGSGPFVFAYAWTVGGVPVGVAGSTLTGAWFDRGDVVVCAATPSDGTTSGAPVSSNPVTIVNAPPTITSVTVTPASPAAGETLSCAWGGYSDPDGDPDRSTVAWTVNGVAAGATPVLAGGYVGGDLVTCTVTPHDGLDAGAPMSTSVRPANTPPSLTSAVITPDPAYAGDTLACAGAGFADADGDADLSYLSWTWNGLAAGGGPTLGLSVVGGDVVTCTVTPWDGVDAGVPVVDTLVVQNSPPVLTSVTLTPDPAYEPDTFVCAPGSISDPDGVASVSTSYRWFVGGVAIAPVTSTLDGAWFSKGQVVWCEATVSDGSASSAPVLSNVVTVSNSAPTLTSASITPSSPSADDTLTCVGVGYFDADGDPDRSTLQWTVNGAAAGTSPTLSSGFGGGDIVACTVTPNDGAVSGTARTTQVVVGNTAPTVASVWIAPDPAYAGDVLSCSWAGFDDPDGDPDLSQVAWTVDGATVAYSPTLATSLAGGQVVGCEVTPFDGSSYGAAVSASLVVTNTAPVLASATLSPDPADVGDTLSCAPGAVSDADGDLGITYTYAWTVGGSPVAATTSTLAAPSFRKGDAVRCTVTPWDATDAGAPVTSNTVTIGNSPPSVASVSIDPDPAEKGDVLGCTWTGFTDADGDADLSTRAWTVNGAPAGAGATLASGFRGGDVVTCTVTPYDGFAAGALVSDTLTVVNNPPVMTVATLSPASVDTNDLLTAFGSATDPDGDALTLTYTWFVDGGRLAATGNTLDGSVWFDKNETVWVEIVASDGVDSSLPMITSAVTVSNTAPAAPAATINPAGPIETLDDLVCTVTVPSYDLDGDTVAYTMTWAVDGVPYTGPLRSTSASGDTVPAEETWPANWACTITPFDGQDYGPTLVVDTDVGVCNPQYLELDGFSEWISVGSGENLFGITNDFSIAAWVRRDGNHVSQTILDAESSMSGTSAYNAGLRMWVGTNDGLNTFYGTGADSSSSTDAYPIYDMELSVWQHVAVVRTARSVRIFYDGIEKYDFALHPGDDVNWHGDAYETDVYQIGRWESDAAGDPALGVESWFHGNMSDLGVWRRVLDDSEVLALATVGYDASMATDMAAFWPMHEGTGTFIEDISGSGLHGTMQGGTWSGPCPPDSPYE